jgi:Lamin Tail Domain
MSDRTRAAAGTQVTDSPSTPNRQLHTLDLRSYDENPYIDTKDNALPEWTVLQKRGVDEQDLRTVLVASLLAAGMIAAQSSAPASAAYCVSIYRIYYNSPGTDTGSNTSLNGEWIQLHNKCSTSRSLTNAKIKDYVGHTYTFGTYSLGGGKYVKVHTGKGTNTTTDRYQGRAWYVWNNDKDTAYLYNSSGTRLDTCSYNNRNASSVYC